MGNACLSDPQKSGICEVLAVAEHCLLEGADEYLQVSRAQTRASTPAPHLLFNCFFFLILAIPFPLFVDILAHLAHPAGDVGGHLHHEDPHHGLIPWPDVGPDTVA